MNPRTHFCFKQIHILNDSVAANVSMVTAAAYSTLGVTTTAIAEAAAADVTVTTATSANLSTAEAAAADLRACQYCGIVFCRKGNSRGSGH
jgi:hypothetical protein